MKMSRPKEELNLSSNNLMVVPEGPRSKTKLVFISYSKTDRQIADMIYDSLKVKGIRCWAAHRDILPGEDWLNSTIDALEFSEVVIVVFSANTEESGWVQDEIKFALERKIKVIPFRIENVEPKGTLRILKMRFQWMDAFTPPLKKHINRLVEVVSQHLGKNA